MTIKRVYVLPGDMLEIRVCDPAFEEGANPSAWNLSARPRSMLVTVISTDSLMVPPLGVYVRAGINPATARQMLIPKGS